MAEQQKTETNDGISIVDLLNLLKDIGTLKANHIPRNYDGCNDSVEYQ